MTEVSNFNGSSNNSIGSASGSVATGFGDGSPLAVTFSDPSPNTSFFHSRSNFAYASFAVAVLLGDVNTDGDVNFLDIAPFIARLFDSVFQAEADMNGDGVVSFADISLFIEALSQQG